MFSRGGGGSRLFSRVGGGGEFVEFFFKKLIVLKNFSNFFKSIELIF